jgi:hypothetical protein
VTPFSISVKRTFMSHTGTLCQVPFQREKL